MLFGLFRIFSLPCGEKIDDHRLIVWRKPDPPFVNLNIDGASKSNHGEAGIGGLFRDSNGQFILGFASYLGNASSMLTESKALLLGLYFAKELGTSNLWIESDSEILVKYLNGILDPQWSIE